MRGQSSEEVRGQGQEVRGEAGVRFSPFSSSEVRGQGQEVRGEAGVRFSPLTSHLSPLTSIYLSPTRIIDSDHEEIKAYTNSVIGDTDASPVSKAVNLYYAVRDGIWYDPYHPFYLPKHYQASNVLKSGRGFCIPKASLLCALGRAAGIPSRIGFASVRNHLATKQLIEFMGTDLFVWHGFTEFYLEGKWVKATPAFNKELCERHNVSPLEFDGREDSVFQPYNMEKQKFMEYVGDHGTYSDIPVDRIVAAWKKTYGEDRVGNWIRELEASGGKLGRNFGKEDVIT